MQDFGSCTVDPDKGRGLITILINRDLPTRARNQTLVHELGHAILFDGYEEHGEEWMEATQTARALFRRARKR